MKVTTKYDIGDRVTTSYPYGPVGVITAVSIRSEDAHDYQISYNQEGTPATAWLTECEVTRTLPKNLGFKGGKNGP